MRSVLAPGKIFLVVFSRFCCYQQQGKRMQELRNFCANDGVLCNSASCPARWFLYNSCQYNKNNVCLAISTGGASPALAKKWLEEQKLWLDNKASFALFMGKLRCIILTTEKNSDLNANFFAKLSIHHLKNGLFHEILINVRHETEQELSSDLYNKSKKRYFMISPEFSTSFTIAIYMLAASIVGLAGAMILRKNICCTVGCWLA